MAVRDCQIPADVLNRAGQNAFDSRSQVKPENWQFSRFQATTLMTAQPESGWVERENRQSPGPKRKAFDLQPHQLFGDGGC